jgi:primosomal protein N' (replication factor Y)
VLALADWAAWRWAGSVVSFLRAASPPNRVDPGLVVEREHAVYPDLLGPGHPWRADALIVTAPAGGIAIELLAAPEGSTIVVDPAPERAARLARELADAGRVVWEWGSVHSDAVRTEAWSGARAGACVVVGGRTAVWAPVPDLTAVVVLDDADEALEDERAPTWNARDVAVERARRVGAAIRIVTPAPTVEAVELLGEPASAPASGSAQLSTRWPRVTVVDPRDEEPGRWLLSSPLADALRRVRGVGGWSVCVLNRRGRARLLACVACGELARCERCGATVEQRADAGNGTGGAGAALVCPQCEATRPAVCLACHGTRLRVVKPGVTKVREDLAALLPRAAVVAVDRTTGTDDELRTADVLVGTEAVLHRATARADRSRPGLVAFLEFDQELLAPRARAAEQALWLLVRAARLVGSRADGGEVLVQTRLPDHEVVRAAAGSDPLLVTEAEAARRRVLGHPPFGGLAELAGAAAAVGAACDALRDLTVAARGVSVLGPVDDGRRALLRAPTVGALCDALGLPAVDAARTIGRLRIDVDPRRA